MHPGDERYNVASFCCEVREVSCRSATWPSGVQVLLGGMNTHPHTLPSAGLRLRQYLCKHIRRRFIWEGGGVRGGKRREMNSESQRRKE